MPPIPSLPWFSYARTALADVECSSPRTLQQSSYRRRSACAVAWSAVVLCMLLAAAFAPWQRHSRGPPENCPPPTVGQPPHCIPAKGPLQMTFYMYGAQDAQDRVMENVNLADLAGVLGYLHDDVIDVVPRRHNIMRIVRYKVTMKNTDALFEKSSLQFGPYVAFSAGHTTDLAQNTVWSQLGFVVGCQRSKKHTGDYTPLNTTSPACTGEAWDLCGAPKWYSLPGPCPQEAPADKKRSCEAAWPGGRCVSLPVTGAANCTYYTESAGEVTLDELVGIHDYRTFAFKKGDHGHEVPNGNREYDVLLDKGVNTSFWDGRYDLGNNTRRMHALQELFERKYPQMPVMLPEPYCHALTTTTTTTTLSPSLFCASVMRSKGYEVPLMKAQVQRGVGIFSCDEHGVFADKVISLGKGVNTTAFPIAPVGVSVDGHAACVQLFLNFWGAVKRDGRFRHYDWTLKVDPDAMMLVDRVRLKLKPHTHEPLQSLFLRTCNRFPINEDFKMPYTGMYGATEAFTRPALETFLTRHNPVCTSLPWQSWGEDNFMAICMHRLGVGHVDDWHFLADPSCYGGNCADDVHAVYHPFKGKGEWLKCLWQATGGGGPVNT